MKEIIIRKNDEDQRFSKFLNRLFKNANDGFSYKMLRKKNITLNGKKADGTEKLKEGDTVRIYFSDETFEKLTASSKTRDYPSLDVSRIVYEDENILIYNKPAGMLSQRSAKTDLSACEYLIGYLQEKNECNTSYTPSFMNRLDRNTTGLILAAKSLKASRELSRMLKDRSLKKEYLTFVKGNVKEGADKSAYLVKDEKTNTVTIRSTGTEAEKIETAYTPVRFCDKLNGTVLLVNLKTGKTHQIRAHLSSLGYPVAGDQKYGDPAFNAMLNRTMRTNYQLLHSYRVTFPRNTGELEYLSGKSFCADAEFLKEIEQVENNVVL